MVGSDHLRAEGLLLDRLKAEVASVPDQHVLSAADLADTDINRQYTPALHVLYWDDVPGDTPGDGPVQLVAQQWMVVVAVRNVRRVRTGSAAREEAGPILTEVFAALNGWDPGEPHEMQPFRRVRAPRRTFDSGFAYFPTLWQTRLETP